MSQWLEEVLTTIHNINVGTEPYTDKDILDTLEEEDWDIEQLTQLHTQLSLIKRLVLRRKRKLSKKS